MLKEYSWDTCPEEVRGEVQPKTVQFYTAIIKNAMHDGRLDINDDTIRAMLDAEWQSALATRLIALNIGDFNSYLILNDISAFLKLRGFWSEGEGVWRHQRDIVRAMVKNTEQLEDENPNPLLRYEGVALTNLGNVYLQQGRWDDAIACYEDSLKVFRALGDRHGEGQTLMGLGNVYGQQGRWADAIACYEDSLKIKRALGDRHGEGQTLGNLGNVYDQQGRWADAIACYEDSLKIFRTLGDRHGICLTIGNRGNIHQQKGELQQALECYQEAARLASELGDAIQLGKALTKIGIDLAMGGELSQAVGAVQQGIDILSQTQDMQSLKWAQGILEQIQQVQGQNS
jgi:tetratricopeptide (TPR) repeat protein